MIGKHLCGDLGADIEELGVNEETVPHACGEVVAEGWFAGGTAEGGVRVEQLAAFKILGGIAVEGDAFEIVFGRGGEADLEAEEILEDIAGVSGDGALASSEITRSKSVGAKRR